MKTIEEIMEPDDRIRLATNLPPGLLILKIPDEFYKTRIPLYILFSETRYEVEEGTKLLNLNPLGKPMALLKAPVRPEALKVMGFVRVFDIIEVPKVTEILRSIEHAYHTKLILRDVTLTAEDVEIIKRMPALKALCCYGVRFAAPNAAVFPRLIEMDFRAVEPSGVEATVLQSAPGIELLTIKDKQLVERDITTICRLRHLRWLALMSCNLTNEWLQKILYGRPSLYYLGVHNTNVTDAGLVGVEKLSDLKYLNVSRCDVGDVTMKRVSKMPRLSLIDACYTNVTDAGIKSLESLSELDTLSVMNTKVTEKCLPGLALKKKLGKICIKGMPASKETLQKLKNALPNCKIK
ncbi:MAG: hypothetical protein K2W95_05305 [Candidatus Obscuribacterales bacterium]|nr:hypothetical protein [Candidatus Obscuribacterales bacterium]